MNTQKDDTSDHIYYNVDIRKPIEYTNLPFQAVFNETRVDTILKDPSKYELAVVRFNIPAQNIPIFIWIDNAFSVSIKYLNFTFTSVLQFIPNSPGGSYDYYGKSIWNYQDLIDSINIGLLASFNDFVAGTPAFVGKPTLPPYMFYTAATELCSLAAPVAYDTTIANPIYIYFNSALGNYFPALQNFGTADAITNKWIRVKNNFNNRADILFNDYYIITEEYSTLFLWNDLQKIVLETDTIPVSSELLGSQTNKTRKIITDFEPLSNVNDRSAIQFYPQGALRFYDLISNYPLTNMNIKVYWQNKNEKVYPIYLSDTDNLTIKLYFKRKGIMVSY